MKKDNDKVKGFDKDLAIGQKAEEYIAKKLESIHGKVSRPEGELKGYDLITEDGYKFEVKFDILSKKTDNIAIEYKCNGVESGISVTTSHEWVHIFYLDDWMVSYIPTDTLKRFIKLNWKHFKKVKGGDKEYSRMVLIPKEIFCEHFCYRCVKGNQ